MNENFGNTPPLSPLFGILQFCTHHPHFSTHFHFSTTIHHDADAVGKTTPVSFFTSNVCLVWIFLFPPNLLSCFSLKPFFFFPGKLFFACFCFVGHGVGEVATMTMRTADDEDRKLKQGSRESKEWARWIRLFFISGVFSQIYHLSFVTFFTNFFQEKYRQWPQRSKWGSGGGRKKSATKGGGGEQRWKLWLLFAGWAKGGGK